MERFTNLTSSTIRIVATYLENYKVGGQPIPEDVIKFIKSQIWALHDDTMQTSMFNTKDAKREENEKENNQT